MKVNRATYEEQVTLHKAPLFRGVCGCVVGLGDGCRSSIFTRRLEGAGSNVSRIFDRFKMLAVMSIGLVSNLFTSGEQ